MKKCPGCEDDKPESAFAVDKTRRSGLQSYCRVCVSERRKPATKKKLRAMRVHYHANVDVSRARVRDSYIRNQAKRIERMRAWRKANPELHRAAVAAWRKAHSEEVRVMNQNRRAREANAPGSYTLDEWLEVVQKYDGRCAYCGRRKKLTVHHVQPISKGGTNFAANLVPACINCNSRIHNKVIRPGVTLG